ncbi:hypothetical protein [Alteromonas sp. a30]|uniref:hypothetical protein n=1 Tax=Alteromonas sp. a30 TaxID=2730917 RepID=UPI002280948B|nr:hypothetical protein [Alteromonas sp. a30]MCY7294296.1 hypothetical protein [Alteromonas sp. a30]
MATETEKLLTRHHDLIQSDNLKVVSHVQREDGDWIQHSLMIEGIEVPFKFKRKKRYKPLQGARVNMTYYPITEEVAGIPFEVMKVVRLRRS